MSSFTGPRVNNTDLKLHIDRDSKRSFIGKPITNFVSSGMSDGTSQVQFSNHGSSVLRAANVYFNSSRPHVIRWESVNTLGYTGFQIPSTQTCTAGFVYTVSFDIYWEKGNSADEITTSNFIIYGSAYKTPNSGSYATNRQTRYEELGDGWRRYYHTYTATYTGTNYFRSNINTNDSEDFKIYVDNIQFEEGYGTPWIQGGTTRPATDVIKDLTNTTTVTALNLDYTADAEQKYSFDGVDAYLTVPSQSHPGDADVSVEFILEHRDDLVGSAYLSYSDSPYNFYMYFRGDWGQDRLWLLRRVTGSNWYGDSAWGTYTGIHQNLPANSKKHVVFTSDASTLEFKVYVNGVLQRTIDGTIDQNPSSPSPVGSLISDKVTMYIGRGGPYLDMDLDLFKIYHRVLDADQVKSNFNNIKNRFGL